MCNERTSRYHVGVRLASKLMRLAAGPVIFAGLLWSGILNGGVLCAQTNNSENTRLSNSERRERLGELKSQLSEAMFVKDRQKIQTIVADSVSILGDRAGLPEAPDDYRDAPPSSATEFNAREIERVVPQVIRFCEERKWWKVGMDPTQGSHALREVATVIEACVQFSEVSEEHRDQLLTIAKDGADFLLWTQSQAETGLFPFPAVRNGTGRPFQVAEAFLKKAEQNGKLGELTRNGWLIDDLDDGGLQFDNALAGVAVLHLYEKTQNPDYLKAVQRSADWAMPRRIVTNWNYNSFSVYLLAEAYRVTGDLRYLESAQEKALLGVLPGQLKAGPQTGRWADPHNARPAYHYIMIRGLAALAKVTPQEHPDRKQLIDALKLALQARNPDFKKGILNTDSTIEALTLIQMDRDGLAQELQDCGNDEVLDLLHRYAAHWVRNNRPAVGPSALGLLINCQK